MKNNEKVVNNEIEKSNNENIKKLLPFLFKNGLVNGLNKKNEEDFELCEKMLIDIAKNKKNDISGNKILKGEESFIEYIIIKFSQNEIKKDKIKDCTTLNLKLPEKFNLLSDIGYYLPNLVNLNLSNSLLYSIEDIGISFKNLTVLNISNTALKNLNTIYSFENLVELDASYNQIDDINDLGMCFKIEILKLNDNLISEKLSFSILKSLQNLKELFIANNPFIIYAKFFTFTNIKLDIEL